MIWLGYNHNQGRGVMDKKLIRVITWVGKEYIPHTVGRKKYRKGPYWFGYWYGNGKRYRVYIGKELPAPLQYLLDNRYKVPGHKRWTWPLPLKRARAKGGVR